MAGALGRLGRRPSAVAGGAIVAALVAFAIVGPLVCAHDPNASDFVHGMGADRAPIGPSGAYWLGTDRVYRDVLARLAYGARESLVIGMAATAIATAIGTAVGVVAGYYEGTDGIRVPWPAVVAGVAAMALAIGGHPGWGAIALLGAVAARLAAEWLAIEPLKEGPRLNADVVLMRAVDVGLSFPFLLLVMAIGTSLERTTMATILIVLGLTGWLGMARVVRSKTLVVRRLDFVEAARALGQPTAQILWRHVLPNVLGPVVVLATLSVAQMILAESVLGYLGVGLPPPTPTWGRMLFEGQDVYLTAPWVLLAPAAALLLAVLGFNLLGEGLRDALDPKEG